VSSRGKYKPIDLEDSDIEKLVMESNNVSVFFDRNLCYKMVNDAACELLNKRAKDLLNKNILDLFPEIVASANHRNLLRALDGQTIRQTMPDRNGNLCRCRYKPIHQQGRLLGVLVTVTHVKQS
jgi:PAS domain-containing protein